MATRTQPTWFLGYDITDTDLNGLPGGAIAHNEVVASQASITTSVALTGYSLTITPPASRILKISFCIFTTIGTLTTNDSMTIALQKDGSQIDAWAVSHHVASGGATCRGFALDINPTNASHTYALFGSRGIGTATYGTGSAFIFIVPGFILIEDVGPSF
jgi:hypothetical protein